MNLQNQILAAIATFIFGAFASWWVTSDYYQARYDAAVARQKAEAVAVLQEATERAIAAERLNNKLAQTLEVSHAQNRQKLDAALSDNRRLARELGGLRDPGYREGSSCTVPSTTTGSGIAIRQPATGRLSAEATEFLLEFARDADRAAEYAGLCSDWIKKLDTEKKAGVQ
jgi:single-stranded DNA-specific DHH superfamily exonuclease